MMMFDKIYVKTEYFFFFSGLCLIWKNYTYGFFLKMHHGINYKSTAIIIIIRPDMPLNLITHDGDAHN